MSNHKFTAFTVDSPDLDPATLTQLLVELTTLERQRERANRLLLKRRRQKSGQ